MKSAPPLPIVDDGWFSSRGHLQAFVSGRAMYSNRLDGLIDSSKFVRSHVKRLQPNGLPHVPRLIEQLVDWTLLAWGYSQALPPDSAAAIADDLTDIMCRLPSTHWKTILATPASEAAPTHAEFLRRRRPRIRKMIQTAEADQVSRS